MRLAPAFALIVIAGCASTRPLETAAARPTEQERSAVMNGEPR